MVFLVGPRQVGKTTLARSLISNPKDGLNYFNWDVAAHRKILSTQIFSGKLDMSGEEKNVVVFDEIHKYGRWKNALKGLFDKYEPNTKWIVTGSAALDVYRKGQDSLVGRSFTYHLCPLSVAELSSPANKEGLINHLIDCPFHKPSEDVQKTFDKLMQFGGFPEPFLKESISFLNRWRVSRLDKLINQDLASIEHLKNLAIVEQLMFLLPERTGNPLSINSLREDLEVHFTTVKHWVKLLERVFYGFTLRPFSGRLSRTLKKEGKWYLWDWTEIPNMGYRLENLVAVHLLKLTHYINDLGLGNLSLHYIRDKEKREVDFVVCGQNKPLLLIECKLQETTPSNSLIYFSRLLKPKRSIQLVAEGIEPVNFDEEGLKVEIVPASAFLNELV